MCSTHHIRVSFMPIKQLIYCLIKEKHILFAPSSTDIDMNLYKYEGYSDETRSFGHIL
jgi:hypothetical protein